MSQFDIFKVQPDGSLRWLAAAASMETAEGRIKRFPPGSLFGWDNDLAKRALASIPNVDVFILGPTAPEQTQREMVDWLKVSFPKAKIVALIPSASPQLLGADYNVPQSDWAAWVSLFATS